MRNSICLTGLLSPSLSLENDDVWYMHYLSPPFQHLSRSLHLVPHRIQSRLWKFESPPLGQKWNWTAFSWFGLMLFGAWMSVKKRRKDMSCSKNEKEKQRITLFRIVLSLIVLSEATSRFFWLTQSLRQYISPLNSSTGCHCGAAATRTLLWFRWRRVLLYTNCTGTKWDRAFVG